MRKCNSFLLASLLSVGLLAGCKDDDPIEDDNTSSGQIEAMATTPEWNNYLVAASSELLDDCISLWAAWNGPTGIPEKDMARIGSDFFTNNASEIGGTGYAVILKDAGTNELYKSQGGAIETILSDGCETIAGEVGTQKIGGPFGFADEGNIDQAVLEVESWYSWNSITDFADNIVSIKNTYFGGKGATSTQPNSISAFVKSKNADLDMEVTNAINKCYTAIKTGMMAPFRNNLTGAGVENAMAACTDLEAVFKKIYPLLDGTDYDFTGTLQIYADMVVVQTYKDMKDRAWDMYNKAVTYQANPTQSNLDAVCEAWRTNRIPWEQSEAFLFGPADVLGLDPSLDSWPLDQSEILGVLKEIKGGKFTTVDQIIGAISADAVRGFHTIELLLFKDGQNRKVK